MINTAMILQTFKKHFSEPTPTAIYLHPDGYLIVAPNTEDLMDYNDPFYIVSKDLQNVTKLGGRDLIKTLDVMKSMPLWER